MYLNTHSYYSLRYGTVEPMQLLALAREQGHTCLALTDINCTAGILEFVRLAPRYNIRPLAGIDFRNGACLCYVGLARTNEGFRELNEHLSMHLHAGLAFGQRAPAWSHAYVIYPMATAPEGPLAPHEFIGVTVRDLARLPFSPWRRKADKLVAMPTATFRDKRDFNTHRLLRAIANNTLLSKLPKSEEGSPDDRLLSPSEMEFAYRDHPFLLVQMRQLTEQCTIHFDFGSTANHQNKKSYTASALEDGELLRRLCDEGLHYRYPHADAAILSRLEKELQVIQEKNFTSYFLINRDITRYAFSKGYYYVGRGSGANSLVAYLLRITDVDPIELDLYFERFINLFRQNPPDFDIDFSWKERDDVTSYIFRRFEHVALLGAFVTFQYSAVIRELGKVFGLPKHEIDLLSDRKMPAEQFDSMHHLVLRYSQYLHDFPNYIGIHSAGILITEQPIHCFGATFMPPKGYATVQFDMHQAEDVGINKLDILSQRGLSKIRDTLDIIRANRPEEPTIDIHDVKRFKTDVRCNELLRNAQAIGCFYVESPAMRMLLTKLQTHSYLGLVAASSVIRPGVASSGMMRQYILRERQPERRAEAPKPLLDLMPETYGVMVYQEDVIKVAHYFAGLSLGEADVLRRGMSGKFRGREEFEHARKKFHDGALERGHPETLVNEVWRQVESFAGYAFAKGHSASYAVESYQCLFLKAYYPIEYMTATINNYGGFYRTEIYVHEARLHGAEIEAPCVNRSFSESVVCGKTIYLGFQTVKSLEHDAHDAILRARRDGLFLSVADFLERVHISLESCALLARLHAFRFTGVSKKEVMWQIHLQLSRTRTTEPAPRLFVSARNPFILPPLEHHWLEDAYDELELLGFPLCPPADLLEHDPEEDVYAADFIHHIGKQIATTGYLTTLKPTRTSRGESMYFGTFLDRHGHFIDTVHFPPVAKQFPVSGWGLFRIQGTVCEEFGAVSIDVRSVHKLRLLSDPRLDDQENHPALNRKNRGTDRWVNHYMQNPSSP